MYYSKMRVYLDSKDKYHSFLKIFTLLFQYLNDDCMTNVIIAFYTNIIKCGLDFGHNCYKNVKMML